jgi:deoxyhypusine synthase
LAAFLGFDPYLCREVPLDRGEKRNQFMGGRDIEPITLWKDMKVKDLMEIFAGMGFNARRLAEAAEIYRRMIREGVNICLTLAGAMTPIGMGGVLITLLEKGWVDWIISTGANLYHDLHRAYGFPMSQGDHLADDEELEAAGVARIYDVFIQEDETMLETDRVILSTFTDLKLDGPVSTADLNYHLGLRVKETARDPEKSFLSLAAELAVPIYVPAWGDSSIGMNMILNHLEGDSVSADPVLDILETAAIVRGAAENGALVVGGGAPKNFFMQTQPTLWQILKDDQGGHDYFIQITTDAPHWGGLSGATASEARSWGKVKNTRVNNVTVYADAGIALPLLCACLLSTAEPRRPRRLMDSKGELLRELKERYLENTAYREQVKKAREYRRE